ncbi:hypothetical protein EV138_5060 [Kribbella voronezhensis]|uniref:PH (Pleckstrin Homology) domain-containing protein n=1 Tax=Kribbella voronezhensis TaxID=2512212 RepID=A0A4R7TGU7_9ACTN|nr:hypothetical protein [Kribbella voronezhensis]TDU91454.1 hypothetical protein EV138_5060 [Kribbella voronezhensis]
MSTADAWSAEFEKAERVVFPQRRDRLAIRLAVFVLLLAMSVWSNVDHVLHGDVSGAVGVLRITALVGFLAVVALTTFQLITRRPTITVDRTGIHVDRRTAGFLPWPEIAHIDDPSGLPGLRTIQVHPIDGSTALGIPQDNARDLSELATWLRTVHAQRTS